MIDAHPPEGGKDFTCLRPGPQVEAGPKQRGRLETQPALGPRRCDGAGPGRALPPRHAS